MGPVQPAPKRELTLTRVFYALESRERTILPKNATGLSRTSNLDELYCQTVPVSRRSCRTEADRVHKHHCGCVSFSWSPPGAGGESWRAHRVSPATICCVSHCVATQRGHTVEAVTLAKTPPPHPHPDSHQLSAHLSSSALLPQPPPQGLLGN